MCQVNFFSGFSYQGFSAPHKQHFKNTSKKFLKTKVKGLVYSCAVASKIFRSITKAKFISPILLQIALKKAKLHEGNRRKG
jgi:hypothetical protein